MSSGVAGGIVVGLSSNKLLTSAIALIILLAVAMGAVFVDEFFE